VEILENQEPEQPLETESQTEQPPTESEQLPTGTEEQLTAESEQLATGTEEQLPTESEQPPTRDVIPSSARRFRPGKKTAILTGVLLALLLIGAAGISYAGYDFSKKYEGKILPGASVAGVDIGGMTHDAALVAVREAVRPQLTREITVTWGKKSWTVTPKELGARSNARSAVNSALSVSDDATFIEKTRMRLFGEDLGFSRDVAITYPRKGSRGFIQGLATALDRDPLDAELDYSSGWVEITKEREGRSVRVNKSVKALQAALTNGGSSVDLSVATLAPEVTKDAYKQVLLVRIGENKLYYYENGQIAREWVVATGLPEYPTPTGVYEITEKRFMPTWVNPSPDGWGSDMPVSIPPGPGNPLGLRALNWSAAAIRFHGTSATYSLGYNASHGCVRMSNEDVIELYDLIDVGVPIVSLNAGPPRPLYGSTSVLDAEIDATREEENKKKKND
jgi:lipoprotein-anchoring transpeptidase ErfK/SrfK